MTEPHVPSQDRGALAAVGALTLLDLSAAAGLARLFSAGLHTVGPILVAVLAGHAVAYGCRWRGLRGRATIGVAVLSAIVLMAWLVVPSSTFYGLPSAATLHAIWRGLGEARTSFSGAVAPTVATTGFRLACVGAVSVFAVISDWGAFRAGATLEAAIPAFTLFVFSAVLGTRRGEVPASLGFASALALFLLAQNAETAGRRRAWFAGAQARGRVALRRGSVGLGAAALLGATLGLAAPFAHNRPAVAWRAHDQPKPRTTVSPLVDIRTRLVNRSNEVAFTVDSSTRAYWRLTGLDTFDGRIWSSKGRYRPAKSGKRLSGAPTDNLVGQHFSIGGLSSIWLPVAYAPATAPTTPTVSYDPSASAFITDSVTSDQLDYTVSSSIRYPTADEMRAAGPSRVDSSETALPPDVDPRVAQLAAQITRAAPTPFDKAFALQNFFRTGAFKYDLAVPPGHDEDALTRFLFTTHRGYCEQFAGTYAVLARLAGLPTRVAVGFTAGERGPDGRLVVRQLNAHAWPEVFLGRVGWVAFEPTPGRGIPGAEGYTGIAETQASSAVAGAVTTLVPTTVPTVTPTTAPAGAPKAPTAAKKPADHRWSTILTAVGATAAAAGAYAGIVPAALWLQRRRRWTSAAGHPAKQVRLAWREATGALHFAGADATVADTPRELAAGAAELLGEEGTTLSRLAQLVDVAAYAPPRLEPHDGFAARGAAESITTAALATRPRVRRVAYALDLRRVLRGLRS